MINKPKIAIAWLGSCAGCDETIVDLNEGLLDIAEKVEIVFWPIALDYKLEDLKARKDKEILLGIVHGSVRNSDQEELARVMREKCRYILSFGACACFGGTPGLANLIEKEEILKWVYVMAPSVENPEEVIPSPVVRLDGKTLTLPEFFEHVYSLDQVIDVDYYLPGCPPPPDLVLNALTGVLTGDLPPKGSTLAPRVALCDTCPRNVSKPQRIEIRRVRRVHELEPDPDVCFLAQGILCFGFATRSGCNSACININTPCRACLGPLPGVNDIGAKIISALSCLVKAGPYGDPRILANSIPDPVGYIYRFSEPKSLLDRKNRRE